jgi:ribosomal protein S18 acetylase RimI-like enzyme
MDGNIFMMCENVDLSAFSVLPPGFSVRYCRKDELPLWKAFPFDDEAAAKDNEKYMADFFNRVYAPKGELFFRRCKFIVEEDTDKPVATCFAWRLYDRITTIHWFKTLKEYENRGIGRALLTIVMSELAPSDYPVYLHTQPESYRAIKLYSDFGFYLLDDRQIGARKNHLTESLPYLKEKMPADAYANLKFASAPEEFLRAADSSETSDF